MNNHVLTIFIDHFLYTNTSNTKSMLTNFSCSITQSGLYIIQGKNGRGKSTLFSLLAGDTFANASYAGTITYNKNQYQLTDKMYKTFAHKTIRTVAQTFDHMLVPTYTALENYAFTKIAHYPTYQPLKPINTIPELLHECNIPLHTPIEQLSGGQRQIVAIIMTLQSQASLLLLDEPTASLDEENTHLVMRFLQHLCTIRTITILMICHDTSLLSYSKHKPFVIH